MGDRSARRPRHTRVRTLTCNLQRRTARVEPLAIVIPSGPVPCHRTLILVSHNGPCPVIQAKGGQPVTDERQRCGVGRRFLIAAARASLPLVR